MAQYVAEPIADSSIADIYIIEDAMKITAPTQKTYPTEPIKGSFLSFYEDLPTGNGDGAGGGSYVWAG